MIFVVKIKLFVSNYNNSLIIKNDPQKTNTLEHLEMDRTLLWILF